MKNLATITIDFETESIDKRPNYPPAPIGVAIKKAGEDAIYLAWGHEDGNNCTKEEATQAVEKAFSNKDGIVFHNAKFDLDVAHVHMGVPSPPPELVHDTMILLFLDDPHQKVHGLKQSYERIFNTPPTEQDEVKGWLLKNKKELDISSSNYKGFLKHAPAELVGAYAKGDVERTEKLFYFLYSKILSSEMLNAYRREQALMPVLLEMEKSGLLVDFEKLKFDVDKFSDIKKEVDAWIFSRLGYEIDGFNIDSADELLDALISNNKIDVKKLPKTPTGKYQTNKAALSYALVDNFIKDALLYRANLSTCLNTFMLPWFKMAVDSGGRIFTTWNQTKIDGGAGTRTGRLSSTPNFQNIPKVLNLGCSFTQLYGELPNVRSYIIPEPNHCFIDRDYSQQELRILAHFEDDTLQETYKKNPWVDLHDHVKKDLEKIGRFYDRKAVKMTNLGVIYGMGVAKLSDQIGIPQEEAKTLKNSILSLYKGLGGLYSSMKVRARNKIPIRTWGGRVYFCEPAEVTEDGRIWEKDYKMVNLLIQGSAADCTKEALIRYHKVKHKDAQIVLCVHDQITVSAPLGIYESEMQALKEAMESIEFDVKMLTEGATSCENWHMLTTYDKKGAIQELNIATT